MTQTPAQALATQLNGRQYGSEMSRDEEAQAKADRLLVIFGASDDLTEFRGLIHDEAEAYDGNRHAITEGLSLYREHDEHDEIISMGYSAPTTLLTIDAKWCPDGFDGSWRIVPSVPHAMFQIMDGDELYCQGAVVQL